MFIPFSAQEISQKNGMYYGLNPLTDNMILLNRKKLHNASGFILGIPGSGKSFSSKREITNVLLNTEDDYVFKKRELNWLRPVESIIVLDLSNDTKVIATQYELNTANELEGNLY